MKRLLSIFLLTAFVGSSVLYAAAQSPLNHTAQVHHSAQETEKKETPPPPPKKSPEEEGAPKAKDPREAMSLTAYRNGYALAAKKLTCDLKTGKHNILCPDSPKTIHPPSLMSSFEGAPGEADILSQSISEEGDTLTFEAMSTFDQVKTLSLRYMFSGLNWDISYVGMISPNHKTINLSGWIEVENNCGVPFKQVQILFHGDAAKMHGFTSQDDGEKSDFSYFMPRLVDLPYGKKVYLNFFSKKDIPLKQDNIVYVGGEYLYDLKGEVKQPEVKQVVEFKNDESSGFHFPLPQGTITLYHQNHNAHIDELIGTYVLHEKAIGQSVPLQISGNVGPAPLTCTIEQTDFKKISTTSSEAGYVLTLTNNGPSSSVRIIVNLPESDWTVIRTSMPYDTNSKRQFSWVLNIPGNQSIEIKYRLKLENIR